MTDILGGFGVLVLFACGTLVGGEGILKGGGGI